MSQVNWSKATSNEFEETLQATMSKLPFSYFTEVFFDWAVIGNGSGIRLGATDAIASAYRIEVEIEPIDLLAGDYRVTFELSWPASIECRLGFVSQASQIRQDIAEARGKTLSIEWRPKRGQPFPSANQVYSLVLKAAELKASLQPGYAPQWFKCNKVSLAAGGMGGGVTLKNFTVSPYSLPQTAFAGVFTLDAKEPLQTANASLAQGSETVIHWNGANQVTKGGDRVIDLPANSNGAAAGIQLEAGSYMVIAIGAAGVYAPEVEKRHPGLVQSVDIELAVEAGGALWQVGSLSNAAILDAKPDYSGKHWPDDYESLTNRADVLTGSFVLDEPGVVSVHVIDYISNINSSYWREHRNDWQDPIVGKMLNRRAKRLPTSARYLYALTASYLETVYESVDVSAEVLIINDKTGELIATNPPSPLSLFSKQFADAGLRFQYQLLLQSSQLKFADGSTKQADLPGNIIPISLNKSRTTIKETKVKTQIISLEEHGYSLDAIYVTGNPANTIHYSDGHYIYLKNGEPVDAKDLEAGKPSRLSLAVSGTVAFEISADAPYFDAYELVSINLVLVPIDVIINDGLEEYLAERSKYSQAAIVDVSDVSNPDKSNHKFKAHLYGSSSSLEFWYDKPAMFAIFLHVDVFEYADTNDYKEFSKEQHLNEHAQLLKQQQEGHPFSPRGIFNVELYPHCAIALFDNQRYSPKAAAAVRLFEGQTRQRRDAREPYSDVRTLTAYELSNLHDNELQIFWIDDNTHTHDNIGKQIKVDAGVYGLRVSGEYTLITGRPDVSFGPQDEPAYAIYTELEANRTVIATDLQHPKSHELEAFRWLDINLPQQVFDEPVQLRLIIRVKTLQTDYNPGSSDNPTFILRFDELHLRIEKIGQLLPPTYRPGYSPVYGFSSVQENGIWNWESLTSGGEKLHLYSGQDIPELFLYKDGLALKPGHYSVGLRAFDSVTGPYDKPVDGLQPAEMFYQDGHADKAVLAIYFQLIVMRYEMDNELNTKMLGASPGNPGDFIQIAASTDASYLKKQSEPYLMTFEPNLNPTGPQGESINFYDITKEPEFTVDDEDYDPYKYRIEILLKVAGVLLSKPVQIPVKGFLQGTNVDVIFYEKEDA